MSSSCGDAPVADEFPVRLAIWLGANGDLVDALVALRRLGPEGAYALDAALGIKRVAVMRLSLGLWSIGYGRR